jgi:hypothetical protein
MEPSKIDIAELKSEMQRLYRDAGDTAALQALYEILLGANLLAEVIAEERQRFKGN